MRSAWFLVALAALPAGAAPRPGKVIRVERKVTDLSGHPRVCILQATDMFGTCTGSRAPEVGERMIAIDRFRVVGVARITQVQPYADGCNQTTSWMIQTTTEGGDFSLARGIVVAVADVPVDMRAARLLDVDASPTGHDLGTDTVFAIDSNGDRVPDVEFVEYACDELGGAMTTSTSGRCYDVWAARSGKTLERLRHERFRTCY